MKNILIILTLLIASTGYVYSQVNSDTINTDVPGGGGGGGGLSAADIDTIAEFNAIIAPDVVDISSSQTLTNKLIDGNGNTVKMLRHATDCTTFTAAVDGQYCWEQDADLLYVCEPTAGTCDTAGEWDAIASVATAAALAANPADCGAGQFATTIAANGDLTCAQVAGSEVANTPAGNIAATDVQTAINELDTEKFPASGGSLDGKITLKSQSLTIADSGNGSHATDTSTTITGNDLYVTCSDADGCDLTLSETNAAGNQTLRVWNTSANTLYLVNSAGVAVTCTGSTASIAQNKSLNFKYFLTPTSQWQQICEQTEWSDLVNVPAFRKTLVQLRPQANEPPATSFATMNTRNSHPALRFNGNVCAIWSFVMPNTYGGNGVTAEIWVVSSETSNDTDWDGSWERITTTQDIDSDSFASAISADNNNNSATSGVATKVSITFTDGAQMDSCASGELCRFRICRDDTSDTGGADTIDYIGGDLKETP